MSTEVSVIVPTFRRPRLLRRCLTALFAQDYDPSSYEIIVVEDAASQETQELIEPWVRYVERRRGDRTVQHRLSRCAHGWLAERGDMDAPCLRYIPLPDHRGPGAARNIGWQKAEGEIIAFTDDDCIPTPGWLRAGVAAFRPGVIAVSGRVVMPLSKAPTDYELNASNLTRAEFVTANCFYRRTVLEHVGGFDERFAEAWREDSDLIFTAMERIDGVVQLEHASEAIVIHPIRPARWGISLVQQRKNMYNALLYKKHPSLYRQRLGRVTPWRYYIILMALLICLTGLITEHSVIALGAAMIWIALTGLFCVERLERTSRSPQHVAEMAITSALIPPVALYWRAKGALKYKVWFL
jgi:glycosyltransferase involved in cell wall biosynthesis